MTLTTEQCEAPEVRHTKETFGPADDQQPNRTTRTQHVEGG